MAGKVCGRDENMKCGTWWHVIFLGQACFNDVYDVFYDINALVDQ